MMQWQVRYTYLDGDRYDMGLWCLIFDLAEDDVDVLAALLEFNEAHADYTSCITSIYLREYHG